MECQCNICAERFDMVEHLPKLLPCRHSFCLACLQQLPNKRCPRCRKLFRGPAKNLPDDLALLELKQEVVDLHADVDVEMVEVAHTSLPSRVPLPPPPPPVRACRVRRFWCTDCDKEADDFCVEEHLVMNLKKVRAERAAPRLAALQADEAALCRLRRELDAAADGVDADLAASHGHLETALDALDRAKQKLQAALGEDQDVFDRASKAAVESGLARDAARLLPALGDPASRCSVSLEGPGGAWTASVQPGQRPAARLLLCQLACAGELRPQGDHGQLDGQPEGHAVGHPLVHHVGQPSGQREGHAVGHPLVQPGGQGDGQIDDHLDDQLDSQPPNQPGGVGELATAPTLAPPRWVERSNGVELDYEAMAEKMLERRRRRVARGADWLKEWTHDGQPPRPGTVVKSNNGWVTVKWDCGGKGTYAMGIKRGDKKVYELKLLPDYGSYTGVGEIQEGSPYFLNVHRLSSSRDDKKKADLLANKKLNKVLVLMNLHCDVSPEWSKEVLRRVAPRVKGLRLLAPDIEHLHIVVDFPALESLFLTSVDTQMMEMALAIPELTELEAQCPFEAPLGTLRLPEERMLTFLCLGVYPLSAAMDVVRGQAATLQDLWLVAASREPYGCPDLAAELRSCGLKKLKTLQLERESDIHFCQHDVESCRVQKRELSDMFTETGLTVEVTCRLCDCDP